MTEEFDYVIVGAGAAGSVLARRLTEDPEITVLVLETGNRRLLPTATQVPAAWPTLQGSPIDRGYRSVPQPGLNGRVTAEPRGKGPGGSSNLYAMMHVRGHSSDYDGWARMGATGWGWQDVAEYFPRIERNVDAGDDDGVQRITDAGSHNPNPTSAAFLNACDELGHPRLSNVNGATMLGAAWHQLDIADRERQGALTAYLDPALARPNLSLRTDCDARQLVFRDSACVGVAYRDHSAQADHTVRARRDVLVCAGAIDSPKLLMLSGVGPADHLQANGIPVVADLSGVGSNFHNHVLTSVVAETRRPVPDGQQNLSESVLFASSGLDPDADAVGAPDLQLAFVHVPYIIGPEEPPANGVTIMPGVVRPHSRGWIRLSSSDPAASPLINPNYLAESSDLDRLVTALQLAQDIFRTSSFSEWFQKEVAPGSGDRAALRSYAVSTAQSYHHQAGSCRMGTDDAAVVDPQLRVRGVTGLRVIDASVIPALPSGNCHTSVLMIAEKGADLVRQIA